MFGYVLPEKPEMKIKDYELFRAFYCGVCKSIGSRWGQLGRLSLNYDSTFLALLLSSLSDDKLCIKRERCIAHPVNKRLAVKNSGIIDYASDMNVLLAYYKLKDDWKDEKSLLSAGGSLVLASAYGKLKKEYSGKCDSMEKRLLELHSLEQEKCASMDKAAEPFAKLMEDLLLYPPMCSDDNTERTLKWIGYNMGKWIYVLDAFDDLEKDIAKKSYNPLIYQFEYKGGDIDAFKDGIQERVEFNLVYSLGQISKAFELLETKNCSDILDNIIYMGMLRKTELILKKRSCKNSEKSV